MGLHSTMTTVVATMAKIKDLLTRAPLDPATVALSPNLKKLSIDLEKMVAQHQLEDEFRKIHDLPPTVSVQLPRGWTPAKGAVLSAAQLSLLRPAAKARKAPAAAKPNAKKRK